MNFENMPMSWLNGWPAIWKMLRIYPVKSSVKPGEIFNKIPDNPPYNPESFRFSDERFR